MLDVSKHIEVFSPARFGSLQVDIIGAGATGSPVAIEAAKLGIANIHVRDFDVIEGHNIANQAYGQGHVGQLKVAALRQIIKEQTGTDVTAHPERVDGTQKLGDVVFLLTDTMSSRGEIFKAGLRYKRHVKLVIETRVGKNSGRIYAFNPNVPAQVRGWEATLYGDDIAETSACGTTITVGSTAKVIAGLAVWQMIRWHQGQLELEQGKAISDPIENELIISLQPMMMIGSSFT